MWLEWFNRSWGILKRLIGSCILLRWLPSRHIEMTTKLMTTDARIGKGTNAPFATIVASLSVLMGLCNAMVCSQDRSHTMLEQQCSNFQVQTSTDVEELSMYYSNKNFKATRLQYTHNVINIWSKQCWLCTTTMVKNLYLHIIDTHVHIHARIQTSNLLKYF